MMNLLLVTVVFPTGGGWIERFVYMLLQWIMSWPNFVSYGLAIIMFTLFIKLIMSPLDFFNKYFMKKNQILMQKVAPEEQRLREVYANDPMALNRERQKLYAKNGGGQAGFGLVMLANLVITIVVFFSVFGALRTISNYNINNQVKELQGVYEQYRGDGDDVLGGKLNEKYDETKVPFLWVKNIWRADTWVSQTMNWKEFETARKDKKIPDAEKSNITEQEYETIFNYIKPEHTGWNGWLLLILLSGGVTFMSAWISSYVARKQSPQKTGTGTKTEPIISYSLRDAKAQSGANGQPAVNPAQMGKMMQVIMPIMMVIFAFSSTAAMAIYIIASSALSTGLTLLMGLIVDWVIKRQKPKKISGEDFDPTVINPHAKYFRNKK